ncbi:MAG TPA: hypothetical protein PKG82_02415 [Myxococcota bacterium]|nr:hypothetical protein [Myxococcota bacterium]
MKSIAVSIALSLFACLMSLSVHAQSAGEEVAPELFELGEIQVKFTNTDYPSVRLDGESWEETEYTQDGRRVSLHRVNRMSQHVVKAIPNVPGFEEAEVVIEPADWKLVKVNKLDRAWKVEKSLTFKKKPVEPKKPAPPPAEDEAGAVAPEVP